MERQIHIKYTKNMDYFITILLPYIEIFLKEYQCININFYTNSEEICNILFEMFGERIITHRVQNMFYITNPNTYETSIFLGKIYDLDEHILLDRPLCLKNNNPLYKLRSNVCIFPKFSKINSKNNVTYEMLKSFMNKNNLLKYDVYFVGDPMERLNTHVGRDIINFHDVIDILQNCNVFITTISQWYYIALICNCRNIVLYDETQKNGTGDANDDNNTTSNYIKEYNPFHCHILRTTNLMSDDVYQFITNVIDKRN